MLLSLYILSPVLALLLAHLIDPNGLGLNTHGTVFGSASPSIPDAFTLIGDHIKECTLLDPLVDCLCIFYRHVHSKELTPTGLAGKLVQQCQCLCLTPLYVILKVIE